MKLSKLAVINKKIDNVLETPLPYWWAFHPAPFLDRPSTELREAWSNERCGVQGGNHESNIGRSKNTVVFFGNDMSVFRKLGVNTELYIKKCDECLDYLRKNFKDCRLCYKPHPSGKEEEVLLNLNNFDIINDKINSELFLFQNRDQIRGVFSLGSASSWSAYGMGFNAHVFYKCFIDVCGDEVTRPTDDFFFGMPQSFFIENFDEKIVDNARILKKDEHLESFFKHKLKDNQGKIWLTAFTVEHVVILIAMAKLVRSLEPAREIGLIISHHRYWDSVSQDYFKKFFDEVVVWPRINYSLRPIKLLQAMQIAWKIRKFKILNGDILISMAQNSFVENCINSYHKKNLRIGMIANKDINLFYNTKNSVYASNNNFRFSKASWFFNAIFEPLLGLNRSLYMFYGQSGSSLITRYQKPLNDVFDHFIILKPPI